MNPVKLTTNIADAEAQTLKKVVHKITTPITKAISDEQKLLGELDSLASCAKTSIIHLKRKQNIPEFIYHITSKENYEKILKDGKMKFSSFEAMGGNCKGVYFVDKDNFLNKWVGRTEKELFGADSNGTPLDIGEMLMLWTCKGTNGTVAIKIPTSNLDLSKLRFRPYIQACKEGMEAYMSGKTSKMVKEGLPLSELSKYINTNEPIEYIYFGDLTPNLFEGYSQTPFSEKMIDMIYNLFN